MHKRRLDSSRLAEFCPTHQRPMLNHSHKRVPAGQRQRGGLDDCVTTVIAAVAAQGATNGDSSSTRVLERERAVPNSWCPRLAACGPTGCLQHWSQPRHAACIALLAVGPVGRQSGPLQMLQSTEPARDSWSMLKPGQPTRHALDVVQPAPAQVGVGIEWILALDSLQGTAQTPGLI